MHLMGVDINHIVELGTRVAQSGAMQVAERVADDVFEYAVGIAIVIYESDAEY